ncbi:hypothetical protein [Achromobacter dolens]|uniref:hypothetical protein n=1 Tax=Achromobacter dolens TaxID=1287738 RepID=UPI0011A51BBF|nr:hypothetical protein [Achromobacter dolens]
MRFTTRWDIESMINNVNDLVATGSGRPPDFWRPFHFVILGMEMKRCGADSLRLPDEQTAYAARMHLWQALDMPCPIQVNEYDPRGRFHPLVPLVDQDAVEEVSAELVEIFRRAAPDSVNSADVVVQELLGNCYAHAGLAGFHGLACAQYWPNGAKAQIAIGDGGMGIRNSLSQNPLYRELLETANSCELATQYEVTSKPGRGHSGYGLTLARQLIEQNGGAFFLISHNEFFLYKQGRVECGTMKVPLQGTLAVLEWNTQVPLDVGQVYDSWPSAEGGDDDDFNF